jgi:hypothetical protein
MALENNSVIKGTTTPEIYKLEDGQRCWIPDAATLVDLGYQYEEVQVCPDEVISLLPVGAPVPTAIEPPNYPDTTLLTSSDSWQQEVYVIERGSRRWIPDTETFDAEGYRGSAVQEIDPEVLNAIPLAAPLDVPERVSTGNMYLPLSTGHLMWTTGSVITATGFVRGTTRTQSVTLFGGFTGGVQLVMSAADGEILGATPPPNPDTHFCAFGVDGRWIGQSDRTDTWETSVAQDIAQNTANLTVMHMWTPRVRLQERVDEAIRSVRKIHELVTEVKSLVGEANAGTWF